MLPNRAGDCDVLSYPQLPLHATKTRRCALFCTRSYLCWASRSSHFCITLLNSYYYFVIRETPHAWSCAIVTRKNGHEREECESNRHSLVQLARDDDCSGS